MNNTATLWARAEELAAAGNLAEAAECYGTILRSTPGHAPSLLQLSYLASLRGRYAEAHGFALRAEATRPTTPSTLIELMSRLRTFNEPAAFRRCIAALPPMSRIPIPQLIAIAAQLSYHNQQGEALRFLDEAYRADPDYPPTLAARGQVLTYLGRFREARADLEACNRRAPRLAQAWWLLSKLGVAEGRSRRIDGLRVLLARASEAATLDDAALLGYALHAELDAQGDHPGAWAALEQACAAKRRLLRYDPHETDRLFDALEQLPVEAPPCDESSDGRRPVFIIGMHRSGTTLLEQLLDRLPGVSGLGELYDFTQAMRLAADHHCRGPLDRQIVERSARIDFSAVGRRYMATTAWRTEGQRFFVDKLPSNFLNAAFICRALPEARLLHMRRDPMETCFSNLRELFSDACPYSYDQSELAHYFQRYERLMDRWGEALPGRILDVDYRELVADTSGQLKRVCSFLGLEHDETMTGEAERSRGVATASAVQVRGAVALPSQPKWTPYADQLETLRRQLAPALGSRAG